MIADACLGIPERVPGQVHRVVSLGIIEDRIIDAYTGCGHDKHQDIFLVIERVQHQGYLIITGLPRIALVGRRGNVAGVGIVTLT